jgi:GH24 family phage-related lysozyme (muramidase)
MEPIKPTKLAPETYNRQLFESIKRREGVVPRVYSDPKGIPTIGIGHALAKRTDGRGDYVLPKRRQLDKKFQDALSKPGFKLSDAGYERLRQAVDLVNKGDAKGAKALIPTYNRNTETSDKNKFGFTLPDAGMRHFFREDQKEHEGRVLDGISDKARELGWDPDKTENFQNALRNSREMQELVSLSYNGIPPDDMPEATKHILNGDRAGAYFEIAYRTNSAGQPDSMRPGIANRRVGEARALLGDPAAWPPEQRKELENILKENGDEIAAYEKHFPAAFKDGGRLSNIQKQAPVPKEDGQPDGGSARPGREPTVDSDGAASPDNESSKPEETEPPDITKFRKDLLKTDPPADEIMLKRTEQLTRDEVSTLTGRRIEMPPGLTRSSDMAEKQVAFFDHFFGNSPDGPIPTQPTAPRVPGGVDLTDALKQIGGRVAQAAAGDSRLDGAIRSLQGGLNRMADDVRVSDGRAAARTVVPEGVLREDGAFGPKTRLALKQSLVTLGPDRVERGLRPFLRF